MDKISIFKEIENKSKIWRKKLDIKMPGINTQAGMALILLYIKNKPVSKKELTDYLKTNGIKSNDVQIGRHLKYKGWYVENYKKGIYTLVDIKKPHPGFIKSKRIMDPSLNWDNLKKEYGYKCATCGSTENEIHRFYGKKVKIQKGHKDPSKSLSKENIIPQCQFCNRQDKDRWIYNNKGRVVGPHNIKYMVDFLCKKGRLNELKGILNEYN